MDPGTPAAMGGELRALRRARGLSRTDLAGAVGSRPVIIGRWERGEETPSPDQVEALARALGPDPGVVTAWQEVVARARVALAAALPGRNRRRAGRPSGLREWVGRLSRLPFGRAASEEAGEEPGSVPAAPYRSYLDDPGERRRYTLRWGLTLAVLGALAILLIWALGQLVDGWRALIDLFRHGPADGGPAGALGALVGW